MSCREAVGPERQTADLEAAHRLWQAQNLHTYAFTLQRSCFCAEYDDAKGLPTAIDYDGAAEIADDEISYRVSDVHPVSPPG